ncbi:hypothetical protein [Novosphingobium terrae]|uniref:hypothetical protein n=1 Tax=Novosphingobium terrae TaxID=2726189 RepID=UPI00197FCD2B|nr:hypothetical protein [Novosphingobium terrae]
MRAIPILALCLLSGVPQQAQASVQDYQIRRLLSDRSDCRVTALTLLPAEAKSAPLRYHAECENPALYPDGVEVACADREDERSCRILTEAKRFRAPNLLPSQPAPEW